MVGKPSQSSGYGQEALSKVCEWLGGPLKGPGVVERHSKRSKRGREALLKIRE